MKNSSPTVHKPVNKAVTPVENIVLLNIEGMTCTNCALGIERYLKKEGLEDVTVNFSTAEAVFRNDKGIPLKKIQKGIERLGYKVIDTSQEQKGMSASEIRLLITLPFTLVLLTSMFLSAAWLHNPWVQLALALPVYLIGMQYFGRSAWASLKSGVPNMDVLITLGSSAAFFYSLAGTLFYLGPSYQFYETAATIITLILVGNVIEQRSVRQTTTSLRQLSKLQPDLARRVIVNATGEIQEELVDVKQIRVGELGRVNTGDRIPVDGVVKSGSGSVDESMITGESLPVGKSEGDETIAGTVLQNGSLLIETAAVGDATALAGIIRLVKEAQQQKPPIQKLADRVSAIFVPAVVGITVITFLVSWLILDIGLQQALMNSVAVLVIACPCAMGLATPTAVMVGVGKAARNGILIKGGVTVEKLNNIRQVVFDKTGTLTTGNFQVAGPEFFGGNPEELKQIWSSLESHSSHPVAQSIVRALGSRKTQPLDEIEELKGMGMRAKYQGINWYAGSERLARQVLGEQFTDSSSGDIFLFNEKQLAGAITLKDDLKPGAKAMIKGLKSLGIQTVLLSGDKEEKCREVAGALGIDQVYAGRLPDQKLEIISRLSREMPTAMVGDGINDAPALSRADLGISMSRATQVAVQSADVILLHEDLQYLLRAFRIGRLTVRTIRQNLFWAFFYNVLAIPLAAAGFLNPMIAALSMAFSDVMVVGNSVRLRFRK